LIPELLNGISHGSPKHVNMFCAFAQFVITRAFQRLNRRKCLKILKLLALQPFIPQVFDAKAKTGSSQPTKGERTAWPLQRHAVRSGES
jgi:hypothetical protein